MQGKSIVTLFKSHKRQIVFGLLGLTAVDALQLMVPRIIGGVITYLTESNYNSPHFINKSAFYLILCGILMALFRFVWRFFLLGTSRKIEKDLRDKYFHKLQSLPMSFFNKHNAGDLMARGVNDIEQIKMACGFGIVVAYDGILLLLFILLSMLSISVEFTLYAATPFVLVSFLIVKYGQKIESLFLSVQKSFSGLTEEARKIIYSIKAIKALNDESNQIKRFHIKSKDYESQNMNLIKLWAGYQPLVTFFTSISIFILILFGSNLVLINKISLGEFSTLMLYLTMLSWPVIAMGLAVDWLKRGNVSLERVNEVMNQEEELDEVSLKTIQDIESIEFRGLNFSYNDQPFLKDIDFKINMGSTLGITGKTASGKTSLASLILKFNNADNLYINNIDVNLINKSSIRSKILYVPQEPIIFSGTIKDNLSFFSENFDSIRAQTSLEVSMFLMDVEKMPDGLDTIVGERGLSLSGGQRQRLSIARAIYQSPQVLIIDDTLSSLDVDTELKIIKNIKSHYRDKILIIVSSRISTVYSLDKILVLDKGSIVESGDAENLIRNEGLFLDLMNVQKILPKQRVLSDE
ncbi:MAG: ABC transporter ATP-binding protein [Thermodesulfobacteriota bacteirum]|nr:ABC transporter ATP-binding protein [Thermodesulfobacteriota bacterium]